MADIEMEQLDLLAPGIVGWPTEGEHETQPRRLGPRAKAAAAVVCCAGLFGWCSMSLGGVPVKTDARSIVELALMGSDTSNTSNTSNWSNTSNTSNWSNTSNKSSMDGACWRVKTSAAAYKDATPALSEDLPALGQAAQKDLLASGFTFVKNWTNRKLDVDSASWWVAGGACVLSFQGEDSPNDVTNEMDPVPRSTWHLEEVHAGLIEEMRHLLFASKMMDDFGHLNPPNCDSVVVTGHSLGGGLAQIFTTMINEERHSQQLGWKVDALYTFGAVPAVSSVDQKNYHTEDGCFAGALYFTATRDSHGIILVDMAKNPSVGAPTFKPMKYVKKVLLFEDEAPIEIPCGEDLPDDMGSCSDEGMHELSVYAKRVGCDIEYMELAN